MKAVVPVVERAGVEADASYVFNSWLRGARASWPEMRTGDYYELQHQRISRLLQTRPLTVLHPEGAPGVIAAWAVTEDGGVVHYVHVRGEYRRMGFATRLIGQRLIATHMTEQGETLKRKLGLRYMPHLLDELGG